MNTSHTFQTPRVTPLRNRPQNSPAVLLRVTARDADRIVRALEEASVALGDSPSGSTFAGSYRELAGTVRLQATHGPFARAGR